MKQLTSTAEVVIALGGAQSVAGLTGRSYKSVWRWQSGEERFPAVTYLTLQNALAEKGLSAPASLWRMGAQPVAKPKEGRAA